MIDLIGYKTNNGSIVIEKVYLDMKNYKWKTICGKCKTEFLSTKRILTDKNKIGLCVSCIRKITSPNRLNLEGERIERWQVIVQSDVRDKHGNVQYECVCDCGQIRSVSGSILKARKSKSCGCLQKDTAKSMCGANSPNWTGGLKYKKTLASRLASERQDGGKRHKLRKYIYKRDNYTCAVCISRRELVAHHMNGWGIFPNERYEETNLITLCQIHHKEFHKLYGNGKNTVEQFIDYYTKFNLDFSNLLIRLNKYKNENSFDKIMEDKCLV